MADPGERRAPIEKMGASRPGFRTTALAGP